jgi:hypothetical protein
MTNKTASKKTAAKSTAKITKATPKAKTPAKAKQVKTEPPTSEPVEVEAVASEAIETDAVKSVAVETDAAKSEQIEEPLHNNALHPKRATSERYEIACLEVSTANRAFLNALREKAELLGTELKGESVGIRDASPELAAVNEQIKFARQGLEILLQERRKLMNVSPEVEAINLKIAGLRKSRSRARQEKKAAAAEIGL